MRVLHISKYDLKGGASRAAFNSVVSQRRAGLEAVFLVGQKAASQDFIYAPSGPGAVLSKIRFIGEKAVQVFAGASDVRSLHFFGTRAKDVERRFRPDLVVLHKIDGVLPIGELPRFTVPVIWRLHDMWPICGTQHYQPNAGMHVSGKIHRAGNWLQQSADSLLYKQKRGIYRRATNLTFCPPSCWLADCVRHSSLFDSPPIVEVIPNGIDSQVFVPKDAKRTREELSIDSNAKVVLFGAAGGSKYRRKGFDLLVAALNRLSAADCRDLQLLIFGDKLPKKIDLPNIRVSTLGTIRNDDRLARIYAAADVLVCPSRQENLSLTVLEALSCGTPVVAFDIGGMPDIIRESENGWLAKPFDVDDLRGKIRLAITLPLAERRHVSEAARRTIIEEFSFESEAAGMLALFQRILDQDALKKHSHLSSINHHD